jgi:hypothetical protein
MASGSAPGHDAAPDAWSTSRAFAGLRHRRRRDGPRARRRHRPIGRCSIASRGRAGDVRAGSFASRVIAAHRRELPEARWPEFHGIDPDDIDGWHED